MIVLTNGPLRPSNLAEYKMLFLDVVLLYLWNTIIVYEIICFCAPSDACLTWMITWRSLIFQKVITIFTAFLFSFDG